MRHFPSFRRPYTRITFSDSIYTVPREICRAALSFPFLSILQPPESGKAICSLAFSTAVFRALSKYFSDKDGSPPRQKKLRRAPMC